MDRINIKKLKITSHTPYVPRRARENSVRANSCFVKRERSSMIEARSSAMASVDMKD
jgi:hypothetical protein